MKKYLTLLMAAFMTLTSVSYAHLPSEEKPLVLVLLGPPGAGKGTHAVPLSEKLSIPHISTGDLFRDNLRKGTPLGKRAKSYIDEGKLVPDELVLDMVFSRISLEDCKKGYILDGFPRSIVQAKALSKKLKDKATLLVIHFNVPDSILVERIVGRVMCKDCKKPFHKTFYPPKKEGVCDNCNGSLYYRDDDSEAVVKSRLNVYHKESAPLIDYYDIQNVLYDINSQKCQREVFEEVMQTVEALLLSMKEKEDGAIAMDHVEKAVIKS